MLFKHLKSSFSVNLLKFFRYDKENYAKIFVHKHGWNTFRKAQFLASAMTAANLIVIYNEYNQDLFNKLSKASFYFCIGAGFTFLAFMGIYSKRTVYMMKWSPSTQTVNISFYNFFRRKQGVVLPCNDLGNMYMTKTGYYCFESTKLGKLYLKLDENELSVYDGMNDLVEDICSGKNTMLDGL